MQKDLTKSFMGERVKMKIELGIVKDEYPLRVIHPALHQLSPPNGNINYRWAQSHEI